MRGALLLCLAIVSCAVLQGRAHDDAIVTLGSLLDGTASADARAHLSHTVDYDEMYPGSHSNGAAYAGSSNGAAYGDSSQSNGAAYGSSHSSSYASGASRTASSNNLPACEPRAAVNREISIEHVALLLPNHESQMVSSRTVQFRLVVRSSCPSAIGLHARCIVWVLSGARRLLRVESGPRRPAVRGVG